MTSAIYQAVKVQAEVAEFEHRRISVSEVLSELGVSRSGYFAWQHHTSAEAAKRAERIKAEIQDIYDSSKQNYGAPKIAEELRKKRETIAARTVGKYMHEIGIKAQWGSPFTMTTQDSELSSQL
jgi:DNA-directed RNA polymerase specialized sigma54-like protein